MKKLIFIDNDDAQSAQRNIFHATDFLKVGCKIDNDYVDTIEIVGDLWRKTRDEIFKLFFEGDTAIITFSVYTKAPVYDSSAQLKMLLYTAGNCQTKDRVYIDASGELLKGLDRMKSIDQLTGAQMFNVLQAINNNYIITYDNWKPKRVIVDFSTYDKNVYQLIDVDVMQILSEESVDNARSRERIRK